MFSVLIANYNNGCYLQEAINSVLIQTYSNWEVILVDDGSTDNSYEVYLKYKNDKRFHIYSNGINCGCGFTKRRCCEFANGDIYGFLDPDDIITKDALEIMVSEHLSKPECSLIYSTHFLWDSVSKNTVISKNIGSMSRGEDFLVSSFNSVSQFATFKKQYYKQTVGIDKSLSRTVDVDLYFKLEEVGLLYYIDKPLYYYRQTNQNSISIGPRAKKSNRIRCSLDAFCRRIASNNPLFLQNREKYIERMRWQMGVYRRSLLYIDKRLIRCCYFYWVANGLSIRSLNHIRKILFQDIS